MRRMVAIIELKYGEFEMVESKPFSQLIHATALAYHSELWEDCILCCMASLTHWHLFVLTVSRKPQESHFVITKYYRSFHDSFAQSSMEFYSD